MTDDDNQRRDEPTGDEGEVRPVGSVPGIDESESIRLAEAGVVTVQGLREADPVDLADRTGFPESTLREWKRAADGDPEPASGGPGAASGSPGAAVGGPEAASEAGGDTDDASGTGLASDGEPERGTTERTPTEVGDDHERPTGAPDRDREPPEDPGRDPTHEPSGEEGPGVDPDRSRDVRSASEVTGAGGDSADEGASRNARGGEVEPERTPPEEPGASGRGSGASADREGGPGETADADPSEEDLEREILPPEERVGPGETLCEGCGQVVDEEAVVCPQCGVRLEGHGGPEPATEGGQGTLESTDERTPKDQQQVDAELAGLASLLIPGAGAFMAGQTTRGAGWLGVLLGVLVLDLIIFVVSLVLISVVVGVLGFLLIPFLHLVVHPIAAYDAYTQAQKINAGEVRVD